MRAFVAVISADRIARCAVLTAGLLCGVLAFFVALPLARSNPFPTPKGGPWTLQNSSVAFKLMPVRAEIEAVRDPEPEIVTASLVALPENEPSSMVAPIEAAKPWPVDAPVKDTPPKSHGAGIMDEVDEYLWDVYQRAPTKRDSSGDFTWKDPAAAKHVGMPLKTYVVAGMEPDFREQLYHAGRAMDAAGVRWAILSAFRDDYRQGLASGFKAHGGNSLHGGSKRTGGYGHGRAADVTSADGDASAVWRWLDAHGSKFGLIRPMPGADPSHIQPRGSWHDIALAMRHVRLAAANDGHEPSPATAEIQSAKHKGVATASR